MHDDRQSEPGADRAVATIGSGTEPAVPRGHEQAHAGDDDQRRQKDGRGHRRHPPDAEHDPGERDPDQPQNREWPGDDGKEKGRREQTEQHRDAGERGLGDGTDGQEEHEAEARDEGDGGSATVCQTPAEARRHQRHGRVEQTEHRIERQGGIQPPRREVLDRPCQLRGEHECSRNEVRRTVFVPDGYCGDRGGERQQCAEEEGRIRRRRFAPGEEHDHGEESRRRNAAAATRFAEAPAEAICDPRQHEIRPDAGGDPGEDSGPALVGVRRPAPEDEGEHGAERAHQVQLGRTANGRHERETGADHQHEAEEQRHVRAVARHGRQIEREDQRDDGRHHRRASEERRGVGALAIREQQSAHLDDRKHEEDGHRERER